VVECRLRAAGQTGHFLRFANGQYVSIAPRARNTTVILNGAAVGATGPDVTNALVTGYRVGRAGSGCITSLVGRQGFCGLDAGFHIVFASVAFLRLNAGK
jgi:hypothetical protein